MSALSTARGRVGAGVETPGSDDLRAIFVAFAGFLLAAC
jgi:hypothetical protein